MKIKQLFTSGLLLSSLFLTTVTTTQTPSDNSLLELVKVSKFESLLQDGFKLGFISSFTQSLQNNPAITELPQDKQAQAEKLAEELGNKILKDIASVDLSESFVQLFLDVAKQNYSQQEVNAMINFYKTPIGQSILTKEPKVMGETTKQAIKLLENNKEFMFALEVAMQQHLPTFEKQLEDLSK